MQIKASTRGSDIIFEGAGSKLKNRYGSGELGAGVKIFFRKVTNLVFPTFENPINFAISEEPMEEDSMMTNEEAEDADGVDDEQDNEESHGAGGEQNRTTRHLFERLCNLETTIALTGNNLGLLYSTLIFCTVIQFLCRKRMWNARSSKTMKYRLLQKNRILAGRVEKLK